MEADQLALLLRQNLCLSDPPRYEERPPPTVHDVSMTAAPSPLTYISQHYTHSGHVTPRPSVIHLDQAELEDILRRHRIDPRSLLPQQVHLFQNADDEQRLRLLELWRISPPVHVPGNTTQPTDMRHEETTARARYETIQGRSMSSPPVVDHVQHAEPYMVSGYDFLTRRDYDDQTRSMLQETTRYNRATDPVYKGPWHIGKGRVGGMENHWAPAAPPPDREVDMM